MQLPKAHFFVCRSPFHCFVARKVIEDFIPKAERVVVFVESLTQPVFSGSGHAVEVIALNSYTQSMGEWKRARENVDSIIASISGCNADCVLYVSDIRWPTNNQLYFLLRLKRNIEFRFYAEGLASYIDRSDRWSLAVKSVLKSFLSTFRLSAPYTAFWGDNLGYERSDVRLLYAPCAHLIRADIGKVEIALNKVALERQSRNALLFLGQPLEQKFTDPGELELLLVSTAKKLKELKFDELYYKPHQFEGPAARNVFSSYGFEIIDVSGLFEDWVSNDWHGRAVASYFSTALITSGMLLPDETVLYSVNYEAAAGAYMNSRDIAQLKASLKYFGCVFI